MNCSLQQRRDAEPSLARQPGKLVWQAAIEKSVADHIVNGLVTVCCSATQQPADVTDIGTWLSAKQSLAMMLSH